MIYGIVPVGGMGTRLGLPFPKELFPLKDRNSYYPVCQHTIDNMLESGCEKIVFVHGKNFKEHIVSMYKTENFSHINNMGERQSEVFTHFLKSINANHDDIFLYGLPDSWYPGNLFLSMKQIPGLVCGMFSTKDTSVVDRLNSDRKFIKCDRRDNSVSTECWGVLKFDFESIAKFSNIIEKTDYEVASALNECSLNLCYGSVYYDLGTWESMNDYWRHVENQK